MIGWLALATLRARVGSFVAALIALMSAAALITACGVLLETGLRGSVATERYAASPLVVAADQSLHFTKSNGKVKAKPLTEHAWLASTTLDRLHRLRDVPGARDAVVELTFTASVVAGNGAVLDGPRGGPSWGHAWSSAVLTPFTLAAGRAPRANDEVVVDARIATRANLRVGQRVTVQSAQRRGGYVVVGITRQALADQAAVFFTDAAARSLAGHPGQVFAIGLPHSSAADIGPVRAALAGTGAHVVSGSARGTVEFTGAAKAKATLISLSGVLGVTSLLVAVVVVTGTFALSIGQRHRELALLRAIAATPRQIRRMIGREAVVVGLLASVPGCAVGLVAASWLRSRFIAFGAMPADLALRHSPFPVAAAVIVTVLGGWGAARIAARRTSRIEPTQALAEAAVEVSGLSRVRVVAGLIVSAGYLVVLVVLTHLHTDAASAPVTLLCAILAVIAVALLGPFLARVSSALLSMPMTVLSRRVGYLAAANNRTNAKRLASLITPITMAVTVSATILFAPTTVRHAADQQRRDGIRASAVIVPDSGPGVPGDLLATVRRAPGVTAATAELRTGIRIGQDKYPATAVSAGHVDRTLDPGVTAGSLADFGPADVAVSTLAAGDRRVRVGDHVTVTLGDGAHASLRVATVYARGLAFGDVILPLGLVAAHVDNPLAADILVRGTSPAKLTAALHGTAGMRVVSPERYRSGVAAADSMGAEVGYLAMALIIAFAAISILNTLAMAMLARSREFATLRLTGMKRRQVVTMIRLETIATTVTAIGLGTALATGVLLAYADGMTPGYRPHAPLLVCGIVVAAVVVLIAAATALPVRFTLRANPVDTVNENG